MNHNGQLFFDRALSFSFLFSVEIMVIGDSAGVLYWWYRIKETKLNIIKLCTPTKLLRIENCSDFIKFPINLLSARI